MGLNDLKKNFEPEKTGKKTPNGGRGMSKVSKPMRSLVNFKR